MDTCRSAAWRPRDQPGSCRHTTLGVTLDWGGRDVLTCRGVLAGDAAEQPGWLGGALLAAGAQRAAPGLGQPGREGDPQLRAGGEGRPGRAGAAGQLDLPFPHPRGGRRRGLTARRWRSWTPVAWEGRGRWSGSGKGSVSGRPRPAGGWTVRWSSGWCSPSSRSAPSNRVASSPARSGLPSGSRSRAALASPTTPPTPRWTSCRAR